MKRALSYTVAIISFAIGSLTGNVAAQTTANGPYYATPSWDQTLPASTRFIVLSNFNNQAVLDRETGLVWQRTPIIANGTFWSLGSRICMANAVGGRFGWRLPTVQELASLIDPTATSGPPLPAGHPFTGIPTTRGAFWTATTEDEGSSGAYIVHWSFVPVVGFGVSVGDVRPKDFTTDQGQGFGAPLQLWCVRGGLQPAPQ